MLRTSSLLANYCAPVLQREKIKKVIRSAVAVRTRGLNLNPYHSDDEMKELTVERRDSIVQSVDIVTFKGKSNHV